MVYYSKWFLLKEKLGRFTTRAIALVALAAILFYGGESALALTQTNLWSITIMLYAAAVILAALVALYFVVKPDVLNKIEDEDD